MDAMSGKNRKVMQEKQFFQVRTMNPARGIYPGRFTTILVLFLTILLGIVLAFSGISLWTYSGPFITAQSPASPTFDFSAEQLVLARCAALRARPGPSASFHSREESERYERGTNATLIRNALIFTGKNNGTETISGDLLLDKGIVKGIGKISGRIIDNTPNLTIINANGAWVTPGLVDLHTHLGVLSTPILAGAIDFDSAKGPIVPFLRSVDGLNTHDESYELAMAGGVTSAQVLPGSSNAIGGQAFIIKLRKTKDRSPSSMVVEPPLGLHIPSGNQLTTTPWRHMKQACGENLIPYGNRMDTMWAYRSAYTEAMKIKVAQDEYCAKAESGLWDALAAPFPEDPRWEMLVDVLRGRVKISTHCYEAVDLDAMIRLSNEFQFSISSFHHASEAWLVPDVLKRMWGGIPSIAIFATNHRFKREAYRGSEFAGRVLADAGIPVIMKSDHPVLSSRHLMHEAQKAHYFGLPPNLALASVTSTPATAAGLSHRIGILDEGSDADVVLWDSHPLRLGATPVKVWIDGILQIPVPSKTDEKDHIEVGKGKEDAEWREVPETPNWDKERKEAIKWDGLPPLEGRKSQNRVFFTNVKSVWRKDSNGSFVQKYPADSRSEATEFATVVVEGGNIICTGTCTSSLDDASASIIDVKGGTIAPGMMSYGSPLGLEAISSEPSTVDGATYDAFKRDVPQILDDVGAIVRAADALQFGTRDALLAYRAGVTLATSSLAKPIYLAGPNAQIISGLSTTFRTGSSHAMQRGAIVQDIAALHVVMGKSYMTTKGVSVSTQIAGLRRLLYGWISEDKETGMWFKRAAEGTIPLVIEVDSLDIMAGLLILKADVEDKIGSRMKMVFAGAAESHLLAKEIGDAGVGVILNPSRPFPMVWDQRRTLPGPPLTNDTTLITLLEHGVVVGLGVRTAAEAQNTRFDVQWAALETNDRLSEERAYELVTGNLEKLLGIRGIDDQSSDLVVYHGGSIFDLSSKVVGIISPSRGLVEVF